MQNYAYIIVVINYIIQLRLKVELIKQELTSVFNLETELLPILFHMKRKGVRVDIEKA